MKVSYRKPKGYDKFRKTLDGGYYLDSDKKTVAKTTYDSFKAPINGKQIMEFKKYAYKHGEDFMIDVPSICTILDRIYVLEEQGTNNKS